MLAAAHAILVRNPEIRPIRDREFYMCGITTAHPHRKDKDARDP